MTVTDSPAAPATEKPLLDVVDLQVTFATEDGVVSAVNGVSFTLQEGEVLGIVGESGSGKSVTMLSAMRLVTGRNAQIKGEILFKGRDLTKLSEDEMQSVRGAEMAMIFQDPMTSLNPVYRVGWQIAEQLRAHTHLSRKAAMQQSIELLDSVGIPNARDRADGYPHEFSGGMRQRVMIAMALSCKPALLIADEPTTALDVTIQAQIIDLLKQLTHELNSSVVLVTHDIGVIADIADRVIVMYAGRIVEQGDKRDVFCDPQHPYTWGLLGSAPRLDRPRPKRLAAIPGQPPSLLRLPEGCPFNPRCSHSFALCESDEPVLRPRRSAQHLDACHLSSEEKETRRNPAILSQWSGPEE
jgi:peptide/nickel transport system ATP-binding protein